MMYNLELGFKPKWIIVLGVVIGIFLGGLIIYAGYQTDQDLLLIGVAVMIFVASLGVIIYFAIKRAVKEVKSDYGIDLEGFMNMDRRSIISGTAEVVSVESTGEYVNNNPEYILILKVNVPGQDIFEVEHKEAFSEETPVSVGGQIPVVIDKNGNVQLLGIMGQEYQILDTKKFVK